MLRSFKNIIDFFELIDGSDFHGQWLSSVCSAKVPLLQSVYFFLACSVVACSLDVFDCVAMHVSQWIMGLKLWLHFLVLIHNLWQCCLTHLLLLRETLRSQQDIEPNDNRSMRKYGQQVNLILLSSYALFSTKFVCLTIKLPPNSGKKK